MRKGRLRQNRAQFRIRNIIRQCAAHMRDGTPLILALDGIQKCGAVPGGVAIGVGEVPATGAVPRQMAKRFQQCRQPPGRGLCAPGKGKPVGRRGMGMGHPVFQPAVACDHGRGDRKRRVKARAFQPHHLARHMGAIIIGQRHGQALKRARTPRFRRRVGQIDEDCIAAQFHRIGSHRIAPDQRRPACQIELPVVPVAGQHAASARTAFTQRAFA